MGEPGYNTGSSSYPAEIDQRVTQTTGMNITPENQNYLIDADIKIQETLGVNPQGGSASVANRLDTGTFPALNIAGVTTLNGATTINAGLLVNGDTRVNGDTFPFTVARTAAAGGFRYMDFEREGVNDWRIEGDDPARYLQFRSGTGAALITMRWYLGGYVDVGLPAPQATPQQGHLNAVGLFSNGSPVTCYVLEKAYGTFDQASWDALMPIDRQTGQRPEHEPAKRFNTRNDLDIETYCQGLRDRKSLPNFPTKAEWASLGKMELGDMCQRLTEAVETLSVHVASLSERVKVLESKSA